VTARVPTRLAVLVALAAAACRPGAPSTSGFDAAAVFAAEVDPTRLMPDVEALAAGHLSDAKVSCEGFTPKDGFPACELSRDAAVTHVQGAFAAAGYLPETRALAGEPLDAFTVVAERRGATWPDEVVLVGAHLDAFYAGADDDSSGVAVMLAVARAAARRDFARTIRFVAFDLEEYGAIGSTRYVEAGLADDVVAVVVLETVGYASREAGSQDSPPGLPLGDVGDFLLVVANEDSAELAGRMVALGNGRGLAKLKGVVAPGDGGYFLSTPLMRSDHGLLWLRGVPSLLLSDTANFRNPHYHEATDLPETLDPAFLSEVARATAGVVALAAEVQP
jgi:Zn-dependent M28 family amino/carboxypeptidase